MPAQRSFTSNVHVAQLARDQRGLLTRDQLATEGVSDSAVDRWVANGILVPVFPRVYRHAAVPESWEQRLLAACLCGGEGTLASHRSAGALWSLDKCERGLIEVLTGRRLRSSGLRCTRTKEIPRCDRSRVQGIPATSVERTLIDLAGDLGADGLEIALDSALRQRLTSLARLKWRLDKCPANKKGLATIKELLAQRSPKAAATESALEARFLQLVRRSKLPSPGQQYRVMDGHHFIARLDFAYPNAKLAVEIDGYRWHAGNHAWNRDRNRNNELARLGWTVLRFTATDLEDPRRVIAQIRGLLHPAMDVNPS